MRNPKIRLARGLILSLCLLSVGCGGRRSDPDQDVTTKPEPAATPAATEPAFETQVPGGAAVLQGDLPMGEEAPDMAYYRDVFGADGGAAAGAAGAGVDGELQRLMQDVYFGFDSARLSPEARQQLAALGTYLLDHPAIGLLIEGHCDERGDAAYNLALGEKRAQTVREFLAGMGVVPTRLLTVSYGEERPVARGHDEESWARNRRAHFRVRGG